MTYYGRWVYKFEEARRQGAAGCLVLHNTDAASYGWHVCVNGHLTDNLALYNPDTRNADELAVKGWLHEHGARKLFDAAGMDMDKASKPNKYPMPVWYHKPCDEYREDWDVSGTLANVNLILSVALSLAN